MGLSTLFDLDSVLFKILRSVNVIARRWVNDVAGAVIRLLYAYRLTGVLTITTDAIIAYI